MFSPNWTNGNVTATTPGNDLNFPSSVGYISVGIAAVCFGSNFIPVKKFESGDGLFFQWVFCITIWMSGLVVHIIRGFPRFWPLAMLGGFFWTTGNIMTVPIIHTVGLAMGLLIWGTLNLLTGWASGRFGWFGLNAEVPEDLAYNYIGVAACCCSAVVVSFIKPTLQNRNEESRSSTYEDRDPLLPSNHHQTHEEEKEPINSGTQPPSYHTIISEPGSSSSSVEKKEDENLSFFQKLSPFYAKISGVVMCIFAGIMYGVNFAPVIYIIDHANASEKCHESPCIEKTSSHHLDYVFSHFTGILLTSTIYFLIYCMFKKNQPKLYPKLVLPAFMSGVIWSVADICFFIANESLSEAISFPIINAGPGLIASLWGVLVFKEIKGKRNLILLLIAFVCMSTGCAFTVISKPGA